jgi:hypothetical protein
MLPYFNRNSRRPDVLLAIAPKLLAHFGIDFREISGFDDDPV